MCTVFWLNLDLELCTSSNGGRFFFKFCCMIILDNFISNLIVFLPWCQTSSVSHKVLDPDLLKTGSSILDASFLFMQ